MFQSARLTLTAWYLCIIMLVSISFSSVIYVVLTREVERFARAQRYRIERRMNSIIPFEKLPLNDPDLIYETTHRLLLALFFVNGIIFVLSGGLGYILAGRTLLPIERMVNEQNRFISDASHEFRTPLTSLKSAFEVYLRDPHPTLTDAKTLIQESIGEVNSMQSLSESLLQLTQLEKQASQQTISTVAISDIIHESIKILSPIAAKHKVRIENIISDVQIRGVRHRLIELVVILLDNAVKYSNSHSKISIRTIKTDGSVTISVKDYGAGIDPKDLPHIFNRFYRADSARTKTNIDGYGLGLSIAKNIVESHNGSIHAISELGKGSTFIVKLPI